MSQPNRVPPPRDDLCRRSAVELSALARRGEASCVEVLEAHLARIDEVDPLVHAVCTLDADAARAAARALDDRRARSPGEPLPPLYGLPMVVKDNKPTRGLRTTWGSPIHADHVPDHDAVDVAILRRLGAVVVGKANLPELSVGGRTHNPLFGSTFNPLDLAKSPAGSSGGNAAAVAAHMTPVTLGSDFGGSIRHPAAFCGLYGLRPTPGLVAQSPGSAPWDPYVVTGPIGRDVADLALVMDAFAGQGDPSDPLSLGARAAADAPSFASACSGEPDFERGLASSLRVLWCGDAGLAVEPGILAACEAAMDAMADAGVRVERIASPFGEAERVYDVLRHWNFFLNLGPTVEANRERVSPHIRWDVDEGAALSAERLRRALREQSAIFRSMVDRLADGRTVLALPTSQVMPFEAGLERVESIDGRAMPFYYSWQASCCVVTVTTCPAISVPLLAAEGALPVGLQLVGPPHGERLLLRIAHAMRAL